MCSNLALNEQETIIAISRGSNTATIFSNDDVYRKRLKRLYGSKLVKTYKHAGKPVAEEYEIDRNLIMFKN